MHSDGGPMMKRKSKDSKLNVVLTAMLVVFVCLLSFSIGVISGKGWSDRDYKVKHIEQDSHLKMAKEDEAPIGEEMTEKEVELLTQKALEEAKAEDPMVAAAAAPAPAAGAKPANAKKPGIALPESDAAPADANAKAPKAKAAAGKEAATSKEPTPANKGPASTSNKIEVKVDGKGERGISSLPPTPSAPPPASIEYTVQVAAYKTMGEAEDHSQKLIDKGFPAFPVKAVIDGADWYRVSIGSFKNRSQAMKYEEALKKQTFVKSTFVQKISRTK